jgi:ABC-2 type transport system ATP-binding protein
MTEPIITATAITKLFEEQAAIRDVSLTIAPGQIFGFIGPSGCGKTTTVRVLVGYYPPTTGESRILQRPSTELTEKERVKIGYMPQLFAFYRDLSVLENLNFAASLYGMGFFRRKRIRKVLEFVELYDHRTKLASQLSGGMQRRLSLAAAMVHDPEVLFLDEPTAGVDPVLRRKFWDYFQELRNQGRTLFVTTQYVSEAAYCDQVGVMMEGNLVCVDSPEGLRKRAYGGDVVELKTAETKPLDPRYLRDLALLPFVKQRPTILDESTMRLVVEDASRAIPELIEFTNDRGLEVQTVERYAPPFDDVFVHLVHSESFAA